MTGEFASGRLLRSALGTALRSRRERQRRTLREVSGQARVSLGYLSEIERGRKEASSELLAAICAALGLRMSTLLREVGEELAAAEDVLAGREGVRLPAPVTLTGRVPGGAAVDRAA